MFSPARALATPFFSLAPAFLAADLISAPTLVTAGSVPTSRAAALRSAEVLWTSAVDQETQKMAARMAKKARKPVSFSGWLTAPLEGGFRFDTAPPSSYEASDRGRRGE